MEHYFGTDGVRGVAGEELTGALAFALGNVAAKLLRREDCANAGERPKNQGERDGAEVRLIIGRDTRASGPWLEEALVAGIEAGGGTALLAGIVPTPAVALLVRELGADGGVVISASHNPPEYNGIKFFDAQGYKLSADLEASFERQLIRELASKDAVTEFTPTELALATPAPHGTPSPRSKALAIPNAAERYIATAVATIRENHSPSLDASCDATSCARVATAVAPAFAGLKVAVDCAHGAAFHTTPAALRELGCEVIAINTSYNGSDINVACGSTNLEPLRRLVAETKADLGLAHDGDADRLIALDAQGGEIDGDFIEAICAHDLKQRGLLDKNTVVSTVMCNLGFTRAMRELDIKVLQTDVGDSNVLAAMRAGGYVLGGEQSGHIIFLRHNSTGDGLITALQLLAAMRASGRSLHELSQVMKKYPQVLINVSVVDKAGLAKLKAIPTAVAQAERRLERAGGGRVLLRPSGTEPLVRVMVEAADETLAQREAEALAEIVRRELA